MSQTNSEGRQRPRFVSFSGIDGAGKTTQIERLCAHLKEAGSRVLLIAFWNDVARLTQIRQKSGHTLFKGDLGVGTPENPVNRQDKNVRAWYMTVVRFFLYFVDAISLRMMMKKILNSDADVIIFDRYLYDELANLPSQNRITRAYARLLIRFTPRPDVSYLLDAEPGEARSRKPEYPLEFLHRNRASYLALSEIVGMKIIDSKSVPGAERQVMQAFDSIPMTQQVKRTKDPATAGRQNFASAEKAE